MKINNIRNEYKYAELSKISVHENPVSQFENWMNEALESKVAEPTAMSLSTVGTDGFPQSRIVLLKFFDENGFIFFHELQ